MPIYFTIQANPDFYLKKCNNFGKEDLFQFIDMKLIYFICFLFGASTTISGQAVLSSGGIQSGSGNISVSATLGELAISRYSGNNLQVTQGFHQTNLTVLGIDDLDPKFKVVAYPNPTPNSLYINLPDYIDTEVKIYNTQGQLISEQILTSSKNEINTTKLTSGIYFLNIYRQFALVKTIKFIKN